MYQPSIKFSHVYTKLLKGANQTIKEATLIGVDRIHLNKMPKGFLCEDTLYQGENEKSYYSLNVGNYLLLVFWSAERLKSGLFTTLRPFRPQKEKYYRGLVGERFKVIVE